MLQTVASSKYETIGPALQEKNLPVGNSDRFCFDKDHGEGNKAKGISPD